MRGPFLSWIPMSGFPLWKKIQEKRIPLSFTLEVTPRCNNNCRHCYINQDTQTGRGKVIPLEALKAVASEAVSLGALWCLVTGGEPLLREDFFDIYLNLKREGLLVSVFTNATLVEKEHVALFKKYPPREVEVSVYGVTEETYERVTRRPGSYKAFRRGLALLHQAGIKVRLKTMALRSNVHELAKIADFCRGHGESLFRFDPFLHLRLDGDQRRNSEIKAERLLPEEIVALERWDRQRFEALKKACGVAVDTPSKYSACDRLFQCGAGKGSFSVNWKGILSLCTSLSHPSCTYDLRKGSIAEAWYQFVPDVRRMRSKRLDFSTRCGSCPIINLCVWCPANAYLETGALDGPVSYFCHVAHARARALEPGARADTEISFPMDLSP